MQQWGQKREARWSTPLTGAAAGTAGAGLSGHLEMAVQPCWECLWKRES